MVETQPISVALVEDHTMVAEALASALAAEPDLDVIGIAGTLADALALVRSRHVDVVVMDYRLPDADGARGTAALREASPRTRVVMLTGLGGNDVVVRAIEAGCAGFLRKTQAIGEVRMAVRRAHAGEVVFTPAMLAEVVGRAGRQKFPGRLSPRELEVLQLLAQGESVEQVSRRLFLSLHTVRNHVRRILVKLGAHSQLEAVAIALREGIVSPEEVG